ncbi:MutS protein msh4 [Coemansia sp. RSA 2440]|nr:MutS protein msh4 [Coemansia sp. RSA 2440]
MQIDPGAWRDLGLEDCGSSENKRERSLFSAIDHTNTKMGSRLLCANILQPSTDLSTIYARQTAVLELLDTEELFFSLSAQLVDMPDIDAAITSLICISQATTSRQVSQAINNVLHVKHILQATVRLAHAFRANIQSTLLQSILGVLTESRVDDLLDHMHAVIREDIGMEKSAQMTRSQRCHAVKDGVDGFLDVSIFDKVTQEVVELVEQYATIQRVADVIRENITILYRVSEAVALLDMIVSFAHHCTLHNCVVPEFSDSINIIQGRHPVLEAVGREVVPNNVSTVSATFTVVSGPNMGGKSTYLRQIIYMAIMAQIGCLYLPCVVLSAVTEDNLDGMRFKATFGTQTQTLYGIRLAEQMGFPDEVIDIAEQVADEVSI